MCAVVNPFPRRSDPFSSGNYRFVADHRHEIPVATRLGSQHAEAVLRIMESHALDKARQHFLS